MKTISVVAAVLCWHKMLEGGGGEGGSVLWYEIFENFPYPLGLKVKVFLGTVDMDDCKTFHFPFCSKLNYLTLIHAIFMGTFWAHI